MRIIVLSCLASGALFHADCVNFGVRTPCHNSGICKGRSGLGCELSVCASLAASDDQIERRSQGTQACFPFRSCRHAEMTTPHQIWKEHWTAHQRRLHFCSRTVALSATVAHPSPAPHRQWRPQRVPEQCPSIGTARPGDALSVLTTAVWTKTPNLASTA
jgi:hypothetical protein